MHSDRTAPAQLAEVNHTASTKSDFFLRSVASTASRKELLFAAAVKSTGRSLGQRSV
jgi:hypothetical protein